MRPIQEALILLVEGKRVGAASSSPALRKAGYNVEVVHTGKQALDALKQLTPDLIVFDTSAMRSTGARTCRRIRKLAVQSPILHCRTEGVALDDSAEADAYLQHPFTSRKLLNRIRALLPAQDTEDQIMRVGKITLYQKKRSVSINNDGEHCLTPKLMGLLQEFMRHPNQLVSRRQLMKNVWKTTYIGDTRTLDVHIRWIREIIEENPTTPETLQTIRGIGYILKIDS